MFGMGTGGSLRLLSPETKLSLDSTAAARPGSVGSAIERPPDSLSSLSQLTRTLKTAQGRASFAPDQGASSALFETSSNQFFGFGSGLRFRFPPFPSRVPSFSCSLLPFPYSLLLQDQALDRLVSSSSIRYRTSTDDLSTLSSSRGLTLF